MPLTEPRVSFVVIGLDEAENLAASIVALSSQGFSREQIEILYVDSGSRDASVAIAGEAGVDRVLSISRSGASAARARNLGLKSVKASYVHFVDGDTQLAPGWTSVGLTALEADPTLVGVEGTLRESSPDSSIYDAVCELDWPATSGEVDYVGGNALYRAEPLREVGGFDPEMRVGEEPELGSRLRASGWRMTHLDSMMAWHNLDIRSLREYLRRNHTGGVACALVAQKTGGLAHGYWSGRLRRTLSHAALLVAPMALALPLAMAAPAAALALACVSPAGLLLLAVRKARSLQRQGVEGRLAAAYGCHAYLSKLPAAVGILSVLARGRARLGRRDSV